MDADSILYGRATGRLPSQEGRTFAPGRVYGRYRVLFALPRGGMGEIVVAEDVEAPPPGRRVVLKRLLEEFVEDEELLELFRDEARITSRLIHPNIVRILDTPIIEGAMCLALEFVAGRNVLQMMRAEKARGALSPPRVAVHLMEQALRGLHHAHTAVDEYGLPLEIVHRDVSPGNILVAFDGSVKITDFGIAKSRMSLASTTAGLLRGTTRYLSPEQIRGGRVSARSDLFSSAVVLVELLTGKALFDRGAVPPTLLAIVRGERPPLAELLPTGIPTLVGVLEASLSVSPFDRPESAAVLADVLLGAQHELGGAISPEELGRYFQSLFGVGPREPSNLSLGAGAAYLIEVGEPFPNPGLDRGALPGARPLNASEFEVPAALRRERSASAPAGLAAAALPPRGPAWPRANARSRSGAAIGPPPVGGDDPSGGRTETPDRSAAAPPLASMPTASGLEAGVFESAVVPPSASRTTASGLEAEGFERARKALYFPPRRARWGWFLGGVVVGALGMFGAIGACDGGGPPLATAGRVPTVE